MQLISSSLTWWCSGYMLREAFRTASVFREPELPELPYPVPAALGSSLFLGLVWPVLLAGLYSYISLCLWECDQGGWPHLGAGRQLGPSALESAHPHRPTPQSTALKSMPIPQAGHLVGAQQTSFLVFSASHEADLFFRCLQRCL